MPDLLSGLGDLGVTSCRVFKIDYMPETVELWLREMGMERRIRKIPKLYDFSSLNLELGSTYIH